MSMVLVVDDNEDTLRIAERTLRPEGHRVRVARSGKEALATIDAVPPDAILLDVMMPEMSGLEVLERLRSSPKSARIPVILLTAKTDDEDVIRGYQQGGDYYITKPATPKQLLDGIRLVLGQEPPAE